MIRTLILNIPMGETIEALSLNDVTGMAEELLVKKVQAVAVSGTGVLDIIVNDGSNSMVLDSGAGEAIATDILLSNTGLKSSTGVSRIMITNHSSTVDAHVYLSVSEKVY